MPRPRLGLTECRGSLTRRGPRTQLSGTFKRYPDGTEWWVAHCDRCDTDQVVRDHVMARHTTEGVAYDANLHVATRDTHGLHADLARRAAAPFEQGTLDLFPEEDPDGEPPF